MAVSEHKRGIGVFPNREAAGVALGELRDSGFSMDSVSVVARDASHGDMMAGADMSNTVVDTNNPVGTKAGESATTGAIAGTALGGLTGLILSVGALTIPGVGPVVAGGALATALGSTLAGGALGATGGGLLGGLIGSEIPVDQAKVYTDNLSQGAYLVMLDGTQDEIGRAEEILRRGGIQEWSVYDAPTNPAEVS